MNKAYLLTGSNMGNRLEYLERAAGLINAGDTKVINRSAIYETAAWGKTDQAPFLNQALEIETSLEAGELMKKLLWIEEATGRKRAEKYGPRTIDIDILLFNHEIINTGLVTVPHPELPNRKFALQPLAEIAGNEEHPVLKKNITELLEQCRDTLPAAIWNSEQS